MILPPTITSLHVPTIQDVQLKLNQHLIPAEDSLYGGMVPNLPYNITMAVVFGILFFYHTGVGIYTKQWWFLVAFFCTCILELLGYCGRAKGYSDVIDIDMFLLQFICLTIGPVFTMGGIYYQLAKIIKIYGRRFSKKISPMMYSYIFIFSDIVSLVIQAVGGGMDGEAVTNNTSTVEGTHVFVGGLAVQVASMTIFQFFWYRLLYFIFIKTRIRYAKEKFGAESEKLVKPWNWFKLIRRIPLRELEPYFDSEYAALRTRSDHRRWALDYFPLAVSFAVIFVYVRCIYRVVELAEGWSGYLITHEFYFIFLDGLMMSLATVLLCVFHPGFAFDGKNVSVPIKQIKWKKMSFRRKSKKNDTVTDTDSVIIERETTSTSNESNNFTNSKAEMQPTDETKDMLEESVQYHNVSIVGNKDMDSDKDNINSKEFTSGL
ncbi:RTA1 domain-containing protein SCDLUD_003167 [Saccharomycodes ludwigii]|uniref:RTA1 domain-containing protein n=1 Tax=Saccharomycodes ludwigii TaxID=36035 RepID=UPI001E884CC8|nr:hypothetical protein SCDLUD_003167 [Saccharomycodes ludwigii]KAH3900196.1 hypothetical protein SCDLUD_003167 [Saccharomycodes ludwigii]